MTWPGRWTLKSGPCAPCIFNEETKCDTIHFVDSKGGTACQMHTHPKNWRPWWPENQLCQHCLVYAINELEEAKSRADKT